MSNSVADIRLNLELVFGVDRIDRFAVGLLHVIYGRVRLLDRLLVLPPFIKQ